LLEEIFELKRETAKIKDPAFSKARTRELKD